MASIQKRKNKNGTSHCRAVIRIKGYPTVCNHFDRKQEAEDWAADVERPIKVGKFNFDQHKQQHTYSQLLDSYINDGALEHIRSAEDEKRVTQRVRLGIWVFAEANTQIPSLTLCVTLCALCALWDKLKSNLTTTA